MKKLSRAFTLVELMIIIAIIAILTAIVVSSLNQAKQKSRDERRIQDIATIQLALEDYYNANRNYPETISGSNFVPRYLPVTLADPSTGDPYMYVGLKPAGTSGCRSYHLGTKLEIASALLSSDLNVNFNSAATPPTTPLCPSGVTTGFDGTDVLVYDVLPKY